MMVFDIDDNTSANDYLEYLEEDRPKIKWILQNHITTEDNTVLVKSGYEYVLDVAKELFDKQNSINSKNIKRSLTNRLY